MISFDTYSESLKHSHQSCAGLIEWFCNFLKTFKEHSSDSTWFSIWFVQSLTLTKFWACTTFHKSVSTYRAERLRIKKLHKTMQSKGILWLKKYLNRSRGCKSARSQSPKKFKLSCHLLVVASQEPGSTFKGKLKVLLFCFIQRVLLYFIRPVLYFYTSEKLSIGQSVLNACID